MTMEANNPHLPHLPHLNDEQWEQWLSSAGGPADAAMEQHMNGCESCRAVSVRLHATMNSFRESAKNAAERDETFWTRQRSHIMAAARGPEVSYGMKYAVPISVAAVLLASAVLLPKHPERKAEPVAISDAVDDAMLLQIQNDIYRDVPNALAPADRVKTERTRVMSAKKTK